MVEELLGLGANLESRAENGSTPLCSAAWMGQVEVARALLQWGARVGVRTVEGLDPVGLAQKAGHEKMAKLLQHAEKVRRGRRATSRDYS